MKQPVGFRYLDYRYAEKMVWGFQTMNNKEYYVINNPDKDDDRVYGNLISEDDMDMLISKQEKFKQGLIKKQEWEELCRLEDIAEQEKQRDKENLFGFDAKLTPMQRGKILKILMKQFRYDGMIMTRKDFIVSKVKEGCEFNQKTFSQAYSKRATNDTKTVYGCFYPASNIFVEITKAECDFANYLIENKIFQSIA